jgi:hypothetical protein
MDDKVSEKDIAVWQQFRQGKMDNKEFFLYFCCGKFQIITYSKKIQTIWQK